MIIRKLILIIVAVMTVFNAFSQERKVQNRPYTDLRPFHYGIHIGVHMQDVEFRNVGPVSITDAEGNTTTSFITCDQDRMDPGFNVGVTGEFRLSEHFQFRIAPAIYFGARHFRFRNISNSEVYEETQNLKSAYITSAFELIFAAPRLNNHRAYIFAGLTPSLNMTRKVADFICLKPFKSFVEIGVGFDEYLPYFKCRPELKFMFGLGNALDTNHPKELRDKNMIAYASSVSAAHTKMITLSFYFE